MIDYAHVSAVFEELYKRAPRLFRAPGRVNLIGEHTDYNDGFVLPVAIERECIVAAAPRKDKRVRVRLIESEDTAEFDLDLPGKGRRESWLDYIEGTAQSLIKRGYALRGADIAIKGDVPLGAGLSSSAALEIAGGYALLCVSDCAIDKVALALAGQQAEHEWVGAKIGIMDQFVVAMGESNHALLIDCRELKARAVKLDTTKVKIAICDTMVKHSLASSEYNTRRRECEQAVEILRERLPGVSALRDVTPEDFELHKQALPSVIRRRAHHVIGENRRTLEAAEAFERSDFKRAGELMFESHESLRDDYEVSCRELDVMVEIASRIEGVRGARMTGGGFGGCTINIVRTECVEQFQNVLKTDYEKQTGIAPEIYLVKADAGVREEVAANARQ